jgi:hypothetical protein
MKRRALFFGALAFLLAASRLCHVSILWAEENLPLAAALQMKNGLFLYRDFWFDKPPLLPAFYLLAGAMDGMPLRLVGAAHALGVAALAFAAARFRWSEREGYLAASAIAFFLVFDTHSAAIPVAADALMLAPHLAAILLTWKRKPFAAGAAAGVAFLCNSKGAFVAAACLMWNWRAFPSLAAGFAIPNAAAVLFLLAHGALIPGYEQVWKWGRTYAGVTFVADPLRNAAIRSANWLGFHAALVVGTAWFWARGRDGERWKWAGWAALSLAAAALGWRFFPRYYFQVLPLLALAGARGFAIGGRYLRVCMLLAALVPLVRFGPRYATLAAGGGVWADTAMDRDSREVSRLVRDMAQPGDTLLIWGFRPEIFVYTGLPAGTRFLDSQPLTGVPADRHLFQSAVLTPELARGNRAELVRTRPSFIVDGLGAYNPRLSITAFEDLQAWLANYEAAGRSAHSTIWRRRK